MKARLKTAGFLHFEEIENWASECNKAKAQI